MSRLDTPVLRVGRYSIFERIAAGGMATVHLGRLDGPIGFSRVVAVKRLHSEYVADKSFVSMFVDEARLTSAIKHANVVSALDVVTAGDELLLVMDYVHGESLATLMRSGPVPIDVAVAIAAGALHGLHAAHEATGKGGAPLGIVHRDVSPQNILVGVDGQPRIIDFGVAKAASRIQTTREGQIKGKLAYMSPEQLNGRTVDRRSDLFALAIVLWELLAGARLFTSSDAGGIVSRVLFADITPPSERRDGIPESLDDVVLRGLARDPDDRFATAREMANVLEESYPAASAAEVGAWVERLAGASLRARHARMQELESSVEASSGEGGAMERVFHDRVARAEAPTETHVVGSAPAVSAGDATSTEAGRSRSRLRRALLVLIPVGVAALSASLVALNRRAGDPATTAKQEVIAPSSVASPPLASTAPSAASEEVPPTASSPSSSSSTGQVIRSPIASPAPVSSTVRRPQRNPRPPSPTPSPAPPSPSSVKASPQCDPPYVWDSERQIKVFKKECLR